MLQELVAKILSLLGEPIPLVEGHWLNITFDVPILVDINAPSTPILQFIYCSEFILIFIGMFLMVYFTHFVNSIGIIHLNLQHLFVFFTFLYILGSFARFYMILVQLKIVTDLDTPYLLLSGLIRMQHYGVSLSSILVITVERSFATYYVIDYEAKTRNWVSVFCAFVSLVYTQCFIIPICFFKASLLYIIIYAVLFAVLAKIVLMGLHQFNVQESKRLSWKAENLRKMKNVNYTLSKKFQVEENLLEVMSFMLVFLIFFVTIFIVVPRVYLGTESYSGQIMISLFDINLALGAILIPFICMWQLRKTKDLPFTQNMYCLKNKRREERQVNPITVFEDVTKSYFDQFHTSWQ
uniref:Serpentine Receptor, class E (Epsilon) n=1 Tax=Caenorhabditis tropicalis TaxID=1561998 RepID=A0A1I7TS15_9PELO